MVNNVGTCDKDKQQDYKGGLAPYDEEISWHFRGPLQLKQFAVYQSGSNKSKKRNLKPTIQERRHGHWEMHKRNEEYRQARKNSEFQAQNIQKRDACKMVTATISGSVVSWMNNYMCSPATGVPAPGGDAKQANMAAPPVTTTRTVTVVEVSRVTLTTTVVPTRTATIGQSSTSSDASSSSQSILSPTSTSSIASLPASSGDSVTQSLAPSLTTSPDPSKIGDSSSLDLASASSVSAPSLDASSGLITTPGVSISLLSTSSSNALSSHADSSTAAASSSASQPATSGSPPSDGDFARTNYYNSKQQTADKVAFLNYMPGQSGVFDTWISHFGASLAYAGSDGITGAGSQEVLKDVLIPDDTEIVIFSEDQCDESCPYSRPDSVAHSKPIFELILSMALILSKEGFETTNALFLFEFVMPLSGKTDQSKNDDMPAIWSLNTRVPLTQQYGDCSCWKSGCGELDVWEVLDPGNNRTKATFHGGSDHSGGSSNWFDRPTSGTMKGAVVFDERSQSVHIYKLDDNFDFGPSLAKNVVDDWLTSAQEDTKKYGNFRLPP
ncbi:MAG: hypothetical protein Q9227_003642 [Pyrenula ochraceoflavens]